MIHMPDPEAEPAFLARVMRAVADSPRPTPTRAFALALGRGSARDAAAAVWVAWHLATGRRAIIAPRVRVRSLGLVLGVLLTLVGVSLVGAATARVVVDTATNGWNGGHRGAGEDGTVPDQSGAGSQVEPTDDGPRSVAESESPGGRPPSARDVDHASGDDDGDAPTDDSGGGQRGQDGDTSQTGRGSNDDAPGSLDPGGKPDAIDRAGSDGQEDAIPSPEGSPTEQDGPSATQSDPRDGSPGGDGSAAGGAVAPGVDGGSAVDPADSGAGQGDTG